MSIKCAFSCFNEEVRVSHLLHLNVRGSLDLLILICLVLKTPLVSLLGLVVILSVVSGKTLFLSFLSVVSRNTFCVASGTSLFNRLFVASHTSEVGGVTFDTFGLAALFTNPVALLLFLGGCDSSGNAVVWLHLAALLSSISFCIAILDSVG